jgi:hypothetical protein
MRVIKMYRSFDTGCFEFDVVVVIRMICRAMEASGVMNS